MLIIKNLKIIINVYKCKICHIYIFIIKYKLLRIIKQLKIKNNNGKIR